MPEKLFGDSEFWKTAVRLALPIALQNLLISSFSLVDTIMIGQLGDIPLAAVGMAGQWNWLMSLFMFGLCSGSSVFIAQYWGIRDMKKIRGIYIITLIHVFGVGVIFAAVGFFTPETVIKLFNSTPEVVSEGASYLRIAVFSYIAIALSNTFSTVLRSTESVKYPLYASAVSAVSNAILNWVLIFGKFGMPQLGVRGAAIATCISSWIGPVILIICSLREKNVLIIEPQRRSQKIQFKLGSGLLMKYYKISSPVIINESLWGIGTICYNIIFGHLGYEKYVAITILRTVEGIAFAFFFGLCNACCVMVGKYIGMGDKNRAISNASRFALIVPLFSLLVGLGIIAARYPIITLFNLNGSLTEQSKAAAAGIFIIYGLELFLRNITYIQIVGIFRSGGDTSTGMKYDLCCVWLIALPLTALAAFVLKLPFIAVYAVMLLSEDLLKAILCLRHFRSLKWIKPVTEQHQADAAEGGDASLPPLG